MEFDSESSPALLVGNLEVDINENKLRRHFARFGIIVELTIKREVTANEQPNPQRNGTYALCHYAETQSAVRAYQKMDKKLLGTKQIKLAFHKLPPTEFVWFANIDEETTATDLYLQCSQYGGVERVTIDKFRELSLVKFDHVDSAENAIKGLRGTILHRRRLQTDYATNAWRNDFFELLDKQNADVESCAEYDNQDETDLNVSINSLTSSRSPIPETSTSPNDDHNYTNTPNILAESTDSEEMLEYELLSVHDEEDNDENPAESLIDMEEEQNFEITMKKEETVMVHKQKEISKNKTEIISVVSLPMVTTTTKKDTESTINNVSKLITKNKPTRQRRAKRRKNPTTIDRSAAMFKCEICPAVFNGRAQLSNHINYLHMGAPQPDATNSSNIQTYTNTPMQHFCEWCPYWTYQKGSLNLHNQRVHMDMLPEQAKQSVREPYRRTVATINEAKLEPCSCTMESTNQYSDEFVIYSPTSSCSPARSEENSLITTTSQQQSPASSASACFILLDCDSDTYDRDNSNDVDHLYEALVDDGADDTEN